jgi:hypothetical protein
LTHESSDRKISRLRNVRSLKARKVMHFVILAMLTVDLIALAIPHGATQNDQDIADLSYRAFSELAQVYRSGGEAHDLVSKLNAAIRMIQQGKIERVTGNETGAIALDARASSAIEIVLAAIPAAQQEAQTQLLIRTIIVIVLVPSSVFLSTFLFAIALKVWRDYERSKLYEMRIVEVKAED